MPQPSKETLALLAIKSILDPETLRGYTIDVADEYQKKIVHMMLRKLALAHNCAEQALKEQRETSNP